jgi:hypothetical protein
MQKLEFDESKFPHLLTIKQRVEEITLFIEKLNKRKVLINNQQAKKSEFQKNEDDILLIQTDWDLAKSHKSLAEKTEYVREFVERLEKYIPEINENYESVVSKAKAYYENNKNSKNNDIAKALENEFKEVEKTDLNENWEVRIKHYLVLKNLLENKKKPK